MVCLDRSIQSNQTGGKGQTSAFLHDQHCTLTHWDKLPHASSGVVQPEVQTARGMQLIVSYRFLQSLETTGNNLVIDIDSLLPKAANYIEQR